MSAPSSAPERSTFRGWQELAAIAMGAVLIRLSFDQPRPESSFPALAVFLLGVGVVSLLWGLRGLAAVPFARLGRWWGARRYRVHVQREAYIYMLILVVLCLGALLGRSNMLLLVFGLMAGPFVLGGQVTLLILKRLSVTRELPEHAFAGQRFPVRVRLANRKPLLSAWMIVAADTVTSPYETVDPGVLFTRVPPRGERAAMYHVAPGVRGRFRFGPLRVTCGFPLGLIERSFALGDVQELLVYPRVGRMSSRWHDEFRRGKQFSERAVARVGVFDEEFQRLREYRSGDNPRAIHWRTTARRNELMIREYQHHRDPELALVLDLWLPERPSAEDERRVEQAVSLAASICADQAHFGGDANVQLTISGAALSHPAEGTRLHSLRSLLERLALADAGPSRDLADGIAEAARVTPHHVRRVLITTRSAFRTLQGPRIEDASGDDVPIDLATFEILVAGPDTLADYLTFDESTEPVTA